MHGLLFQGAKCENVPKGNLECTYEGEVEQWSKEEVEREREGAGGDDRIA